MIDLRARRRQLGLSQEALARSLGVSGNTVRRWEAGTVPRARMRTRLARLLAVPVDDLSFGGVLRSPAQTADEDG